MRIFKPRPRYRVNYHAVSKHLGVNLRGNETFDELLKIEQQVKENKKLVQKKFPPFDESVKTYNDIFRYETDDERRQRIAEEKANIQRVDAQVKGVKKW
tara:strand:+ start:170 stop:466 length:297 start_codon:yes stop_codon:yes gene_type:complete